MSDIKYVCCLLLRAVNYIITAIHRAIRGEGIPYEFPKFIGSMVEDLRGRIRDNPDWEYALALLLEAAVQVDREEFDRAFELVYKAVNYAARAIASVYNVSIPPEYL